LSNYLLAFIPLFVAIDVIGILPLFLSFTLRMKDQERAQVVRQSIVTAFAVSIGFLVLGKVIFRALGITPDDFKVAGGLILLIIAITDLLFPQKMFGRPSSGPVDIGIVPIGVPLIVGAGALTAILLCVDQYGYLPTLVSLVVNLLIVYFVFSHTGRIMKILGEGGAKATAKVISILLASIGVMMIRTGLSGLIRS